VNIIFYLKALLIEYKSKIFFMKKYEYALIFVIITILLVGCDIKIPTISTPDTSTEKNLVGKRIISGQASFYADKFNGKPTASGQTFDNNKLTAAHKTLPFGTRVIVKNLKNQKKVTVVINDRLPKTSKREIDLSKAAAKSLDMIKDGVTNVEITIL
jgi:rare lipoprotein A